MQGVYLPVLRSATQKVFGSNQTHSVPTNQESTRCKELYRPCGAHAMLSFRRGMYFDMDHSPGARDAGCCAVFKGSTTRPLVVVVVVVPVAHVLCVSSYAPLQSGDSVTPVRPSVRPVGGAWGKIVARAAP